MSSAPLKTNSTSPSHVHAALCFDALENSSADDPPAIDLADFPEVAVVVAAIGIDTRRALKLSFIVAGVGTSCEIEMMIDNGMGMVMVH